MILFFDGVCNLCNGFVDFLVRRDKQAVLKFAPLEGETARARGVAVKESVVLLDGDEIHLASDAALRTLAALGGPWRAATWLMAIPRPVREAVYRFVARNRYRWFGKRDSCRLPTPEERARFLP